MKIFITLILVVGFLQNICAQSDAEPAYSTIHFVRNNNFFGSSCRTDILLPNQRKFNLLLKSVVHYKIYSTGDILITCEVFCPATENTGATTSAKQLTLSIKSNEEYYVLYNGSKFEVTPFSEIEKSYNKGLKKELSVKEDLSHPIDNRSIVTQDNGPSQGTGFLLNKEGYIVTNHHVIENRDEVNVRGILGDFNTTFKAKVVSIDRQSDLAIIQVESNFINFSEPPYQIGISKNVLKGEEVFAFGYPMKNIMGDELKITNGIINSLSGYQGSISEFQFSAGVQPGNSGGPLINSNGEVIGIVTSKISAAEAESVGYAIKSDYLAFFLMQIGNIQTNQSENQMNGKSLPEMVDLISNSIYIIEAE